MWIKSYQSWNQTYNYTMPTATPQWTYTARRWSFLRWACTPCILPDILAAPSYVWPRSCDSGRFRRIKTSLAIFSPVVDVTWYRPMNSSLGCKSLSTKRRQKDSCSSPAASCVPSMIREYWTTGNDKISFVMSCTIVLLTILRTSFWILGLVKLLGRWSQLVSSSSSLYLISWWKLPSLLSCPLKALPCLAKHIIPPTIFKRLFLATCCCFCNWEESCVPIGCLQCKCVVIAAEWQSLSSCWENLWSAFFQLLNPVLMKAPSALLAKEDFWSPKYLAQ